MRREGTRWKKWTRCTVIMIFSARIFASLSLLFSSFVSFEALGLIVDCCYCCSLSCRWFEIDAEVDLTAAGLRPESPLKATFSLVCGARRGGLLLLRSHRMRCRR